MSSSQSNTSDERAPAKRAKTAQEQEQSDEDEYSENNKQAEDQNVSIVERSSVEWQSLSKDDNSSFVLTRVCNVENEPAIFMLRGKRGYVELIRNGEMMRLHCTKESSGALFVKGVVSDSGTTVAALTDNFVVYVWDIVSWSSPKILYAVHTSAKVESKGQRRSSFIGLSQSGKYLIVHEIDSPIFVWSSCHMETGDGSITTSAKIVATLQGPSRGSAAECTAMAFDDEERFLTLGFLFIQGNSSKQYESCFYDFHAMHAAYGSGTIMQPRGCLRGQDNRVCSVAFGNTGNHVLTCSEDAKAMIWRLDTFKCAMFLLHPIGTAVSNGRIISDGGHIVTAATDGLIRIWGCYPKHPRDGRGSMPLLCKLEPPKEIRREGAKLLHFALTRDGQSLVACWRCAPSSAESQSNGQSDSNHFDVALDPSKLSKSLSGENKATTTLAEVLHGAVASKNKSEGSNGREARSLEENFLAIVRYDAIPLLVRAYRANVALVLSQLADKHGMVPTHELRFKSRVMKFLSSVAPN